MSLRAESTDQLLFKACQKAVDIAETARESYRRGVPSEKLYKDYRTGNLRGDWMLSNVMSYNMHTLDFLPERNQKSMRICFSSFFEFNSLEKESLK